MKILIVLFASFLCSTFVTNNTRTIKIKDVRKSKNWQENIQTTYAKNKAVEIYRINDEQSGYLTAIYKNQNGVIECDKSMVFTSEHDYEFAEYTWVTDNIINITLFNKKNRNVEEYHIDNCTKQLIVGIYKPQFLAQQ